MPHSDNPYDFTVVIYIVHGDGVLLVDHKKHHMWLPVGGHVEPDEDPEEALYREIQEECGLTVEVMGERPRYNDDIAKPLIAPAYMDSHGITETHSHIGMVYFGTSATEETALSEEHHALRWFTREELADPAWNIRPAIRFYAEQALSRYGSE